MLSALQLAVMLFVVDTAFVATAHARVSTELSMQGAILGCLLCFLRIHTSSLAMLCFCLYVSQVVVSYIELSNTGNF